MEYDYESHELLLEAVDLGHIEKGTPAYGIALYCIDNGYDSLSPPQKSIFDKQVMPHLRTIQQQRDVNDRMRGMPD